MKTLILTLIPLLAFSFFLIVGCKNEANKEPEFKGEKGVAYITQNELKAMMDKGEKFTLVDVLTPESYSQHHIKSAINIPYEKIETEAPTMLKKDEKIVVYCASYLCPASTAAFKKLTEMGYKNVFDYKGGLEEWQKAGFPM